MAGLMTTASQTAPDLPVQMLTTTYNTFTQWFFAYQMGTAIEVLIVAGLVFVCRPYLPFVISKLWTHLPVVGIMNRVRNIAPFGGFTLRNGMYRREWDNNIMYYVKKYLGSYFFMGVAFDIVHIDRGFVQDPIMNKYVATLTVMGYKNIQAIDDALTFNNISKDDEQTQEILDCMGYLSYDSAKNVINPSNLTTASLIYAPKYSNIPLDSLLGYGAEIGPGSIAAQVDDIFEYRKPPVEKDRLLELLPYIILLMALGLAAAMVISQVK
jgi:hypothetical protein